MAQTKKVYQPDLTKKVSVSATLQANDLNAYLYVLQNGGPQALSTSDKLSGAQITFFLKGYQATLDSLTNTSFRAFNQFYKEGESKWAADTLKAFKSAKK
jgi:hypothetical protein